MRDINRIPVILDKFKILWASDQSSDLRFGQLVYILSQKLGKDDIFNIEDDEWVKVIDEMLKEVSK